LPYNFQIGQDGLKSAFQKTKRFLTAQVDLQKYPRMYGSDEVEDAVLDWRNYLALNLDQKPDNILNYNDVPILAQRIRQTKPNTPDHLVPFLRRFRVQDNVIESSKLLFRYLSGARQNKDVRCHICSEHGHVVIILSM